MARARNIKPGFFTNEDLVEFDFATRLLFIGLWTVADREGRLQDRPKKIKIDVFPADNLDVDAMLSTLHNGGFINRYEVNGAKFIQITNWNKHQNPHHTEKASDIPASNGELTVKPPLKPEQAPNTDGGNLADSLIPDSLIPDSQIQEESAAHSTPAKRTSAKPRPETIAKPEDVAEQTWADWCQLRKEKRASVTQTVLSGARQEAGKAGMTLEDFLQVWCRRGSQGLEADWLKPEERKQSAPAKQAKSFAQQEREAGWARWEEMTNRTHPDRIKAEQQSGQVIDITPRNLEIAQ